MKIIKNTTDVLQLSSRTWFWGGGVDVTFDSFMNNVEISEKRALTTDTRRFGLSEVRDAIVVSDTRNRRRTVHRVALCVDGRLHKGAYRLSGQFADGNDAEKIKELINRWLDRRFA